MKNNEKEILFTEFQKNWGEQYNKIPYILKYIATYPNVIDKLNDFHPVCAEDLHNSQKDWIGLISQFDNPIETIFFKPYWVPIQLDSYDYFIDLSLETLPLFEIKYFFFEPYRWYKKHIIKDLTQFLINLDNSKFSLEKHFERLDAQRWLEVQDLFDERDKMGFEGQLVLDPIEKNDIIYEEQNSDYNLKDNSITFYGINPLIIGLLPNDLSVNLGTFEAPHCRVKDVSKKVKTIKALVYLIQSSGKLSIDSYSISFDSENKCRGEFVDNIFKITHSNTQLLKDLKEKYDFYKKGG